MELIKIKYNKALNLDSFIKVNYLNRCVYSIDVDEIKNKDIFKICLEKDGFQYACQRSENVSENVFDEGITYKYKPLTVNYPLTIVQAVEIATKGSESVSEEGKRICMLSGNVVIKDRYNDRFSVVLISKDKLDLKFKELPSKKEKLKKILSDFDMTIEELKEIVNYDSKGL